MTSGGTMRRRQFSQAAALEVANKVKLTKGRCPTCGADLGRDSRPPVEGKHVEFRDNGKPNPRGPKSRY
jgi:hypothetical protein